MTTPEILHQTLGSLASIRICDFHGSVAQGAACAATSQCDGANSYCQVPAGQQCGVCAMRAPANGLLHWAENGTVLVWRDGSTIAFREEMVQIIEWLAPNGLPSFGAIVFLLAACRSKVPAVAEAIGRRDLLTDPRFSDPEKLTANMPQLTSILDDVFAAQPMPYWQKVFQDVNVTFGAVRGPQEVIEDPQLRLNDIVVPLEGAPGKLTSTISSPIQVQGVKKVPARRAPSLGEHNEAVLKELGFSADDMAALLSSGALGKAKQ